jgi:hypothetical protein
VCLQQGRVVADLQRGSEAFDAACAACAPTEYGSEKQNREHKGRTPMDLDIVALSRLQFAVTALYHFLFVPLTLGLSSSSPSWRRST